MKKEYEPTKKYEPTDGISGILLKRILMTRLGGRSSLDGYTENLLVELARPIRLTPGQRLNIVGQMSRDERKLLAGEGERLADERSEIIAENDKRRKEAARDLMNQFHGPDSGTGHII